MRYGGIERSLLDVLRNLDYEKYEIDLLLIEGKGDYFKEIPPQVNIIYKDLNNTYGPFLNSIVNSLKRKDLLSLFTRFIFLGKKVIDPSFLKFLRIPLLGNKYYDFAIGYRTGICTDIIQYTVKANKKATWWHHGMINLSEKQLKEFEQISHHLKNIVVVSESCEKMLVEAKPFIKNYITIIPNMVDDECINQKALEFTPNYAPKKLHFVTACRISPEKHVENIIFASEILLKKGFSDFQWHLIGDGDDFEKLQTVVKDKSMSEHVIFEGKKENPYPYMKKGDLYIHTSYVESQGLSILEAMALNVPCIITDNEGIRDFANINNSIIVNQDADHLANAILEIVNNKEKYNLLKLNTKCPDRFAAISIIKKIEQFLS